MDLKTLGRDEKWHIFVHEGPGIYRHYSYNRWERLPALTIPVEERAYTLEEAVQWVESQMMNETPISQEELEMFKRGWWSSYDGKASTEPDYQKPPPPPLTKGQFRCEKCGGEFFLPKYRYGFHDSLCRNCRFKLGGGL